MSIPNSKQVTQSCDKTSFEESQKTLDQRIQGFDYTSLTPQIRILVQGKTSELKSLMRRSAQDIINIGYKLIEVKEKLGHGNFRAWLKAEFDWSVRTATRFMQVATQFKCANLAHLNIAVSALYLLAETSTPEEARKQALELASKGENINHTKAKAIVNHHRELAQSNTYKPATINVCTQPEEPSLFVRTMQNQSQNTPFQLEIKNENKTLPETTLEITSTIQSHKGLEQKGINNNDSILKEDPEVRTKLQPEHSDYIRVVNIEHKNSELPLNITQTFEMTFAHISVVFEGDPKELIILLEQMQNNPGFTKKVIQEAKLLAANQYH